MEYKIKEQINIKKIMLEDELCYKINSKLINGK